MRSLELKIPPVALVILLGALMWVVTRTMPGFAFNLPGRLVITTGLAVCGTVVALLGVVSFRRARTTVNPLHPEAASALVVSGIFKVTRNPMYLGLLLVLLGWSVFLANALAFGIAVAFIPLMNRLQIGPEEKVLFARFEAEFAAYQSAVRRWL